jgi:transposase
MLVRSGAARGYRCCCSGCRRFATTLHDLHERRVRDLPLFEHLVELIVLRVRVVRCSCTDPPSSYSGPCGLAEVSVDSRPHGQAWRDVDDV